MNEYIIFVDKKDKRWHYVRQQYTHFFGYPITEEIVRCRDCKHCMSYWQSDYCDYFSHVTNDPDGFCAWAERKVDE